MLTYSPPDTTIISLIAAGRPVPLSVVERELERSSLGEEQQAVVWLRAWCEAQARSDSAGAVTPARATFASLVPAG